MCHSDDCPCIQSLAVVVVSYCVSVIKPITFSQRPSVRSLCYFCSDYLTFFISNQVLCILHVCITVINGRRRCVYDVMMIEVQVIAKSS